MGRILYIVYLWLFFVPVFLVLTILTAVTVIIGGRENLRLLSGYDLVSIDLLSGALSGDGKRA